MAKGLMGPSGGTTRQCHHCKEWIERGAPHDCWSTTEAALTRDLSEDLREAWERLRETVAAFGEQRIYASHKSIMFARTTCYCFVRPRQRSLEISFFLGRTLRAPQVRRIERRSETKIAHIVHVSHRDEVEAPITDWLQEAYESSDELSGNAQRKVPGSATTGGASRTTSRKNTKTRRKLLDD